MLKNRKRHCPLFIIFNEYQNKLCVTKSKQIVRILTRDPPVQIQYCKSIH